ncbi:hypothetical protein FVE85_7415 [Porphyridium purpureum]|uniref:CAP N-terminal domain-containing protein n=1 Tax=Porphyridium purpureum TaxID=35688 RepID=A0A5J4Z9M5_PORPP|nr:hypothetical protein FVE85_7415 [Porphyridium purpureum]|eukprot:POR2918..scf295_1
MPGKVCIESGRATMAEALKASLAADMKRLDTTSERLGLRMQPSVKGFQSSVEEMIKVVAEYGGKPVLDLETAFGTLEGSIELVTEVRDGVSKNDLLELHILLLGDAVAAFCWVNDPEPVACCDNALLSMESGIAALREKSVRSDPVHAEFADAVESIIKKIRSFVQEHYASGLFAA